MIKNTEYLKYFKEYFLRLSKAKQKKIKDLFKDAQVCPVEYNEITKLPKDNSELEVKDFIFKTMLNNDNAIKIFQKYECTLEYKYSTFYKITNKLTKDFWNIENPKLEGDKKVEYLNKDTTIEKASFHRIGNKIYFKFSFRLEKYIEQFFDTLYNKLTFILIVDIIGNNIEIRYDGTTRPFKTTQESYISYIKKIISFMKENLELEIEPIDFTFLTLKENKEKLKKINYHVLETDAQYEDCGSAILSCNEERKRPFVDEIKNILDEKGLEFKNDPREYAVFEEIQRELVDFLDTKENEARYKKMVIEFLQYRTTFNYIHQEDNIVCIIHHENIKSNERGRVDHVSDIIFKLDRELNSDRATS